MPRLAISLNLSHNNYLHRILVVYLNIGISYKNNLQHWGCYGLGKILKKRVLPHKSLTRHPYLSWQEDTSTTITIRYATVSKKADTIYYGRSANLNHRIVTNSGNEKEVTLRHLQPGTKYNYRIGLKKPVYNFHTAPQDFAPFSFGVFGDSQNGSKQIKLRLCQALRKAHPDFLLNTGDLVKNGNEKYWWKNDFFATIGKLSSFLPLMAIPGNHDGEGPLFNHYFRYPGSLSWYSFTYASALFIALDTQANYLPGSAQYEFLVKTLQESIKTWKFVYLHMPPYSSNQGHQSDLLVREILCPIFEKYGIDIVFSGHNHCYERTLPILNNQVDRNLGVTYITTGGGGAALKPFISWTDLTDAEKKWCNVRIKIHHYVLARIEDEKLLVSAKDLFGNTIDSFELTNQNLRRNK